MILLTTQEGRHVDDGDFIRLRDGECDYSEERVLREHLASCGTCRENGERINLLADGLVAAVGEIEHAVEVQLPRRETARGSVHRPFTETSPAWRSRRFQRAAAVVVAVLALAMTTAPARALVAAGWQVVKTLFVGSRAAEPIVQQATSLVTFVPQGEEFLIDFVHMQSRGTLSVVVDTVSSASARVLGGDGLDELVVLQAGLRIRNRAQSSASYEFRLPQSLELIEVRVAGQTVGRYALEELAAQARWEIALSIPRAR